MREIKTSLSGSGGLRMKGGARRTTPRTPQGNQIVLS